VGNVSGVGSLLNNTNSASESALKLLSTFGLPNADCK